MAKKTNWNILNLLRRAHRNWILLETSQSKNDLNLKVLALRLGLNLKDDYETPGDGGHRNRILTKTFENAVKKTFRVKNFSIHYEQRQFYTPSRHPNFHLPLTL